MENDKGFIKLSRRFFSNIMWNEARTFSSCEAWLDLIQSARFDATPRKVCIGGREVVYNRGQYPASIRFLAKRWQWSEKKVRSFLEHLRKEGMITSECTQGVNIITLCKYDEYNSCDLPDGTGKGTTKGTTKGTDNNMEINSLKEELAQVRAQLRAQPMNNNPPQSEFSQKLGHTKGTNTKKEEESNKKKKALSNESEKEKFLSALSPENIDYRKFIKWLMEHAPYCFVHLKIPTEKELDKLKSKYTGKELSDVIEKIENRSDLRKRYVNLYRTVLDWSKREYGS